MSQIAVAEVQNQAQTSKASASGTLQRKCDRCRKKKPNLQRSAVDSIPEMVPPTAPDELRPPRALDAATKAPMEVQSGQDFSQIPVHSRSQAGIQAKLTANTPGDVFEQEADRVAGQVLSASEHAFGGAMPLYIQRFAGQPTGQLDAAPASVDQALASPGRPLEPDLREDMEQRFGHDFSNVRVHSGAAAERSARDMQAIAYTAGRDIVFGANRFAPGSHEGRRLLAHELTHFVQQTGSTGSKHVISRMPDDCAADPDRPAMPSRDEFGSNEELGAVRGSIFERRRLEIQLGDSKPAVALIQRLLLNTVCEGVNRNRLRAEFGDQRYGPATRQAVRRFQREHKDAIDRPLDSDGRVGPLTLGAMDGLAGVTPVPPPRDPEGTGRCFGIAGQGPGEFAALSQVPPLSGFALGVQVWELSNFDVLKSFVKTEHRQFLKTVVVPKINPKPADEYRVRIIGEASTTAGPQINYPLSEARAQCVRLALLRAGLDRESRIYPVIAVGEMYAQFRRLAGGQLPIDEVEDRAARKVSIVLVPHAVPDQNCPDSVKGRASRTFVARAMCNSPTSISVYIGDQSDPAHPTYRRFLWVHDPWPAGCIFQAGPPKPFEALFERVVAGGDLRLARGNPAASNARSDFGGHAVLRSAGGGSLLDGQNNPYRFGVPGQWNPDPCANTPRETIGQMLPMGPVECGEVPAPPRGACEPPDADVCTEAYRMSAAQHYNGKLIGGTADIKRVLPSRIPIPVGAAVALIDFGTTDLDPLPLSRQFLYVGLGLDGGEALDRVKLASAPEKDAGKPVQLATKDPEDLTSGSDFNEWGAAKLVIHGGSNKIEVETGDAGTFVFFNLLCNRETRTYYGVMHSAGSVTCTAVDDLGIQERKCDEDEDCSEGTRVAGHNAFTVKVGRATQNSLPPRARAIVGKLGCKVTAAFLNIESNDSKEKIHREFALVAREDDCRFTVARGDRSLSVLFERQLATKDPDSSWAPSDFAGLSFLNKDSQLKIFSASSLPVFFDLPGAFDPACAGARGASGAVVPLTPVECGPTPEPPHDTSSYVSHTEQCNEYKKTHQALVDAYARRLKAGAYDVVLNYPGIILLNWDTYNVLRMMPAGSRNIDVSFIGTIASRSGATPTKIVGFADFEKLANNSDGSLTILLLSPFCAFDENGNVVLIQPDGCIEGFVRKGDTTRIGPVPYSSGGGGSGNPP